MSSKRLSSLAALLVAATLAVSAASATTITVGDFLEDYESIPEALDNAEAGDTIEVSAGTYYVSDGIKIELPGIVLQGEDAATTILDGEGSAYAVVKIAAPGVTIRGFTLQGGSSHGIYINDTNWAVIDQNVITHNRDRGVLMGMGKPHGVVTNNTFVNNSVSAIYTYLEDPRTRITGNIIAGNGRGIVTDNGSLKGLTVNYNCFWSQSSDADQARVGKGNFVADPLFADTANGDFHLQSGSPCLGRGQNGSDIGALGVGEAQTPSAPSTQTVTGGQDFGSVYSALRSAGIGDTVRVPAGTYAVPDGVEIKQSGLVLLGAGAESTILDGQGKAYAVVKVAAPGVTIRGFTLRGGSSHGIYISDQNSATVDRNVITGNDDRGMLLGMGTPHAVITHNTFVKNRVSAIYSYLEDPRTRLNGNIFASNGRGIVTDSGTLKGLTVEYNCFWDQSTDDVQSKVGRGNFTADPLFASAAGGDFHLLSGSPCLGRGENGRDIGALGKGDGSKPAPAPVAPDKTSHRIVIFANDNAIAEKVLNGLRNAGFTNSGSYIGPGPNSTPNIKYGAATEALVDEVARRVHDYYQGDLKREATLENTDTDIFINLP